MVGDRFKEMRKKVNNNNKKSDIDECSCVSWHSTKSLLRSSKVIWWPGMRVDWTSARRWVTSAGHCSRQAVNRWWDVEITVSFSNFNFLFSGDGDGKAYIWDWKTTKLLSKWKAHDDVCIQAISSLYSLWTTRHSYSPARHILQIFKLIPTCRCCGTPTRPARWPLLGGMAWSSSGIEILQTYLMAKVCAKGELVDLP